MKTNRELVENLIKKGVLQTEEIISAFYNIDRKDFVLPEYRDKAYVDNALPIYNGQTISQPLTVAVMLENLQPQKGDKVLEIGAGSGYLTSLLAHIVGEEGSVYAFEIDDDLCDFARSNISKYSFLDKGIVEVFCKSGYQGFAKESPFDKIVVSAAGDEVPPQYLLQLKEGGRLVMPLSGPIPKLFVVEKTGKDSFSSRDIEGFVFVPLNK